MECLNWNANNINILTNLGSGNTAISYQDCVTFCQSNAPSFTYLGLWSYEVDSLGNTDDVCQCYSGTPQGPSETSCVETSNPAYGDGNYYMYGTVVVETVGGLGGSLLALIPC